MRANTHKGHAHTLIESSTQTHTQTQTHNSKVASHRSICGYFLGISGMSSQIESNTAPHNEKSDNTVISRYIVSMFTQS